ncbi:MAG TPA: hypothetical protein VFS59_09185 [Gemmatimonadaceae bacterium]|nr:hypothetical protein [Gemmatimonadaceae bacterium]
MHERLSRRGVAVADRLLDLGLERGDVGVCQRRVSVPSVVCQLLTSGFEAGELAGERVDSLAAERLGHGAVLECAEVAVERGVGPGDLGVERLTLLLPAGSVGVEVGGGLADRVADEVGLLEQAGELVEHGGFERGCWDAFGVACLSAVAVS